MTRWPTCGHKLLSPAILSWAPGAVSATYVQMLGRLSEFEGTCLTLLVRGLAPPPAAIEEALSRLPSERFAVTRLPPYNPSFGFVADRLMLSWAVRSAGATAFVSTLHTHPYRVRKLPSAVLG